MNPLLSIIIPSYNYGRYLPLALDSILSQDFQSYEIILIDDGSTDNSPLISEAFASKHPQIKYKRHIVNQGLFSRAEEGLKISRGKYIHFFSADDLYLPGYLSTFMNIFSANSSIGLVCCDMGYFQDEKEEIDVKRLLQDQKIPCFFSSEEILKIFQTTDFWIPGTSCIAKKELILKHEGYLPALENISDWFLYHRVALFEGVAYVPQNLIAMRVHDSTYTRQVKKNKKRRRATYHHLFKILEQKKEVREKFKKSALLTFIFKELFWKLLINPKYLDFWPYVNLKYPIKKRFFGSLFK